MRYRYCREFDKKEDRVMPDEILNDVVETEAFADKPWPDRPMLRSLVASVRKGDRVVVERWVHLDTNLSRLFELLRILTVRGVAVCARADELCISDPKCSAMAGLYAASLATNERRSAGRRSSDRNAELPTWNGKYVPFGKMVARVGAKKRAVLVDDPIFSQIRDEIYFLRVAGRSYQSILAGLKSKYPKRCARWTTGTISKMMRELHKQIIRGQVTAPLPPLAPEAS